MIARPCLPNDIAAVQAQPEQQDDQGLMIGQAFIMTLNSFALSFWQDNTCVGCAGVTPTPLGSGFAWALLGKAAGPHMLAITRHACRTLDIVPYRRVETTALCGFAPAYRWLTMQLGFVMEAELMRCYDSAGRDHALYARVRT